MRAIRPAVVIVCLAVGWVTSASAIAADYQVLTCSPTATDITMRSNASWFGDQIGRGLLATGTCPAGLGFRSTGSTRGDRSSWFFWKNGLPNSKISMQVSGAGPDGYEYVLYACVWPFNNSDGTRTRTGCTRIAPIPQPGVGASASFTAELPRGASPDVTAECVADTCGAGQGITFNEAVITATDNEMPTVTSLSGYLSSGSGFTDLNGWNARDNLVATFYLWDASGIGQATARIDDRYPFWTSEYCRMASGPNYFSSVSLPCPNNMSWGGALDVRGLPDGWHTLTIWANDALGNFGDAPEQRRFGIDGAAPAPPEDLTAIGVTPAVWTTRESVDLTWRNPEEDAPSETESGVRGGWYDVEPGVPAPAGADPDPVEVPYLGAQRNTIRGVALPSEGMRNVYVRLVDAAGNIGSRARIAVGRDRDRPPAPEPQPHGWLSRGDLIQGVSQGWNNPPAPALESGICGYATSINASRDSDPIPEMNLAGPVTEMTIPPNLPTGDNFFHLRAISCAGLASATATTPLMVDDVRPRLSLTGLPSGEWSAAPVTVTASAIDEHSGVASVSHAVDDGPAVSVAGSVAAFEVAEGVHALDLFARDRAGNRSEELHREVRVDLTTPSAWFEPRDPARPARLRAHVSDELSRPDHARLEFRRVGGASAWQELPATKRVEDAGRGAVVLDAEIPDAQLPEGSYEFRVVAEDVAGNSIAVGEDYSGIPMVLALPLRAAMELTAGVAKVKSCLSANGRACARRARCRAKTARCKPLAVIDTAHAAAALLVKFGQNTALVGGLIDQRSHPVVGREVRVYRAAKGAGSVLVGTAITNAAGHFELRLPSGPSGRMTARTVGTESELPAAATADIGVRSGLSLRISRNVTRLGRPVRLSGRLLSAGNADPAGRLLEPQFFNPASGGWQSFASTVKTDANGKFSLPYTFTRARRPVRFRLRVAIRAQAGWPFEDGASNEVAIRVAP